MKLRMNDIRKVRCMKKDNKGFSLIELIIVIAIMAVLVAVIAPNLSKYLSSSKRKTDISNIDTIKGVIEQSCALTNTEVSEPQSLGTWVELKENSVYYDSDAADVDGYTAFSRSVAEALGEVPKSKVTGKDFWVKIEQDSTTGIYTVTVKSKS